MVAVDLVEGFTDSDASAFQFHMNQGQTVHKYGNIIAGLVCSLFFLILVDDLQAVVVDVRLVNQLDVLGRALVGL